MSKFQAKLVRKKEVARDTLSFQFDLQGERFEFLPGQFLTLSLSSLPSAERSRIFSIASSPEEPLLMVATRMTGSAFKRNLAAMERGSNVTIEGPGGSFVFDIPEDVPVVFVAGGIGITPFRSMVRRLMERESDHRVRLVMSNRTVLDAPFFDELTQWTRERRSICLMATLTQPDKSPRSWNGCTGHIDEAFVRKHIPELPDAVFYVAGPPRFVKAVKQALVDSAVPPDRLRAEEFSGY